MDNCLVKPTETCFISSWIPLFNRGSNSFLWQPNSLLDQKLRSTGFKEGCSGVQFSSHIPLPPSLMPLLLPFSYTLTPFTQASLVAVSCYKQMFLSSFLMNISPFHHTHPFKAYALFTDGSSSTSPSGNPKASHLPHCWHPTKLVDYNTDLPLHYLFPYIVSSLTWSSPKADNISPTFWNPLGI